MRLIVHVAITESRLNEQAPSVRSYVRELGWAASKIGAVVEAVDVPQTSRFSRLEVAVDVSHPTLDWDELHKALSRRTLLVDTEQVSRVHHRAGAEPAVVAFFETGQAQGAQVAHMLVRKGWSADSFYTIGAHDLVVARAPLAPLGPARDVKVNAWFGQAEVIDYIAIYAEQLPEWNVKSLFRLELGG